MGHWVEAGDGYSWVEDPAAPVDTQQNLFGPAAGLPALVGPPAPATAAASYNPILSNKGIDPEFLKSVATSISKDSFNPSDYIIDNSSGETGPMAPEVHTINKDIGNDLQAAYDPYTGNLQTIYYKDQSKGGYWNPQGQFIPYQKTGGGFGSFLSGMFSGIKDLATSDMVKTMAPMVISGGLGGATGIGNLLGVNPIVGGAIAGGGTAALTGGDVLKGALMGGIGGAGNVSIGDTGVNLGQVNAGINVAKNLESGNLLGALTGATNIAGAGNTEIGNTGFTLNDLAKDINLAKAVASGNPQALMGALTSVAQSATQNADTNAAIADYTTPAAATTTADAGSNLPALNSDVMQQLTAAFTNPQDLSNTPSVQVASADPASALAALQETQAPTVEQATVPTQAEQQPAVNELVKQLETAQTPQTVEQIMKAEPAPAVSQAPQFDVGEFINAVNSGAGQAYINAHNLNPADIENQVGFGQGQMDYYGLHGAGYEAPTVAKEAAAEAAMTQVTPAAQEVATVNTPEEAATQVQDLLKQIGVGSNPEAQQAITDLLATNPAPAVNNTETTGVFQDIPANLVQPDTAQTVEQILASEPTPAVSPIVEAATPAAQDVINQAVSEPAVSPISPEELVTVPTQAEQQPAVEELIKQIEATQPTNQTVEQILESEPTPAVSPVGPTETSNTLPTPFTEGPESLDDFLKTIGITSTYPDTTPIDSNQDIVDTFDYTHGKAADINNYYENDGTSSTSTADKDSTILDTPAVSDYVAPTDEETQDYIDRHILETPAVEDYVAPTDEETQDYVDRHILDTPDVEDYVAPTDEETQDYVDRHILDTPDVEDYVAPTDEETQDYVDRHILDDPDVEDYVAPTDEETQDYIDRHILDEPPPEVEDGESPTEQDVIDYVDDHPNDGEEDGEDEEGGDEEPEGGGTGKVNIGGGTKTKGGTTVTPKSTATTKPAADTAALKKLLAGLLASQQTQYLPGIGDVAHIKSNESLFGAIPGTESPASSANEDNYDPVSELLAQGDEEYAHGGHVEDLDVEALLQILRS